MKRFFTWPVTFEKIEFWAGTGIYLFALFNLTMIATNASPYYHPDDYADFVTHGLKYSYTYNFLLPWVLKCTAYYLCYCLLNFFTVKKIAYLKAVKLNIALTIITVILLITTLTVIDGLLLKSYIFAVYKSPWVVYKYLLKENLILVFILSVVFIPYTVVKYLILGLSKHAKPFRLNIPPVAWDCLVMVILWAIAATGGRSKIVDGLLPVLLYWFAYAVIIPYLKTQKKGYSVYTIYSIVLVAITLFILAFSFYLYYGLARIPLFPELSINVFVYLMIFHLAWFLYHYRERKSKIKGLTTALGVSSANLDLLRSQINPHFLFNALNTLYGTALQEKARRTGEGIQKLGDMMRFMLHENVQESIPLGREVEYLRNYISLQKLRTQSSPEIVIKTKIAKQFNDLHIVPMLLIPFVENAFKHGISMREPSFIKIALHTVGSRLYFDVHNSIHIRPNNDPEKYNNGIGLENVRQRLDLMYPERYDLTIRKTAKEFFIHLTIEL